MAVKQSTKEPQLHWKLEVSISELMDFVDDKDCGKEWSCIRQSFEVETTPSGEVL